MVQLAAGVRNFFSALVNDAVREFHPQKTGGLLDAWLQGPVNLLVLQRNLVYGVERLQNIFIGAQSERAQEDSPQELALAVDAHIKNVLLVVFKLHPGAAVRNDFPEEVSAVRGSLKEDAR